MKTYIIIVSKYFMKGHPHAGQPTYFAEKIASGEKIHTIRGSYEYWSRIVSEVNAGRAILSVRQWTGLPYNSKQVEIKQLTALGLQSISMDKPLISIDGGDYLDGDGLVKLATNDGLSVGNFYDWFPVKITDWCIIHFNPRFQYQ